MFLKLNFAVEIPRTKRTESGSRLLHEVRGQSRGNGSFTGRCRRARDHVLRCWTTQGGVHTRVRVCPAMGSQLLGQRRRSGGDLRVESCAEQCIISRIGELGRLYRVTAVSVNCKYDFIRSLNIYVSIIIDRWDQISE